MSREFSDILRGLMDNRRLEPITVAKSSGRAVSTIHQLINGAIPPNAENLKYIAPVLQIPLADLLVMAGLPTDPLPELDGPYAATAEIGELIAAATWLTPEQVKKVTGLARDLKGRNRGERV